MNRPFPRSALAVAIVLAIAAPATIAAETGAHISTAIVASIQLSNDLVVSVLGFIEGLGRNLRIL